MARCAPNASHSDNLGPPGGRQIAPFEQPCAKCDGTSFWNKFRTFYHAASTFYYAASQFHYLQPRHWPTHRRICSEASRHLTAAWLCLRCMPRNRATLRHTRCATCGWLTGKLSTDEPLCYECYNSAICRDCTYLLPGLGLRCYDCPHCPSTSIAAYNLCWHSLTTPVEPATQCSGSASAHPKK